MNALMIMPTKILGSLDIDLIIIALKRSFVLMKKNVEQKQIEFESNKCDIIEKPPLPMNVAHLMTVKDTNRKFHVNFWA